ncbi:MAG: universal stress protein [Desulfobacterales bacterium]
MRQLEKSIIIPVDGSENSFKALDYVENILGPEHNVKILICYILPSLPMIFEGDSDLTREERARLRSIERKNIELAEKIMAEAKAKMLEKGFPEDRVQTLYQKKQRSVTKDVCYYAESRRSDTIVLTRRGKTEIKDLFMGEISKNFVEYCQQVPVWIIGGSVTSKKVLVALDASDNALRAVGHAGFMLSGTDCEVMLFHTIRNIGRFIPSEILKEAPDVEETWRKKAGEEITPYIERSQKILVESGFPENNISVKVVEGTRNPANDIVNFAKTNDFGTIVLGRRGISMFKEFFMGSVTSKVLQQSDALAVWIVH